jgi:hypothetical protein
MLVIQSALDLNLAVIHPKTSDLSNRQGKRVSAVQHGITLEIRRIRSSDKRQTRVLLKPRRLQGRWISLLISKRFE